MKTAIKRENDKFLVISLQHVSGLTGLANPLGTQKLWKITHATAIKHENDEFLVIYHKHITGLKVIVNHPGTPKPWEIAHENGHKTRKRRISCHISPTCK